MEDKHKSNPPKGMGKNEYAERLWQHDKAVAEKASRDDFGQTKAKPAVPPIVPAPGPSGQMPAPEVKAVEPVLPSKAAAFPGATFDVDQTPPPPVEKAVPAPKPVPNAPNVKKAEGITYIGKYKKFHAEFKTGGRTYNVGMFDTLELAEKALNKEKAEYNL